MKEKPKITEFVDDEEKEIVDSIEQDNYDIGKDLLTPERRKELTSAAKATIVKLRDG